MSLTIVAMEVHYWTEHYRYSGETSHICRAIFRATDDDLDEVFSGGYVRNGLDFQVNLHGFDIGISDDATLGEALHEKKFSSRYTGMIYGD